MVKKVAVVSAVLIVLVVGVAIGVVAFVHLRNANPKNGSTASTKAATIDTICSHTEYKETCFHSLSPVAKNQSATPKDFLVAAIEAAFEEVKKLPEVVAFVKKTVKESIDPLHHMALKDCEDFIQYAIEELRDSQQLIVQASESDPTIGDDHRDLVNWLTAVYYYQRTCIDQIHDPRYKTDLEKGMTNATRLTHNALDFVARISDILLTAFNVPTTTIPDVKFNSRRRLLVELADGDYPAWISAHDRRLLRRVVVKPNVVVAKDGSGQFNTISAALGSYPTQHSGRFIIYVKAGIYDEHVVVEKHHHHVFIYGDGPLKTIITGSRNQKISKFTIADSATFSALGNGFMAKGIGFRNTAGPRGEQAVALRVMGDKTGIFNCRIEGYQDTLYYQSHSQFYSNCYISGTVDFIFGTGIAVIQNSEIVVRRPELGQLNVLTADGKEHANDEVGLVIQNCTIRAEKELYPVRFQVPTYLGRPWKPSSLTVVMESDLGDFIRPKGWVKWPGNANYETCNYAEYANRGPCAKVDKRVKWKGYHVITDKIEARKFAVTNFLRDSKRLKKSKKSVSHS